VNIFDLHQKRREIDKMRFEELDGDLCMLCGAYGADKRNFRLNVFYDVSEVIPEALDMFLVDQSGWYLRICKTCRGELLRHLEAWRNERVAMRDVSKDHDGYPEEDELQGDIPVRINGMTVMMTAEQYEEYKKRIMTARRL